MGNEKIEKKKKKEMNFSNEKIECKKENTFQKIKHMTH